MPRRAGIHWSLARHPARLSRCNRVAAIRTEQTTYRIRPAKTDALAIGTLDDASVRRLNEKLLMEIQLDKRSTKQIRLSAADAIEEGDTEALREDVIEAFSEEQVEEIERRLDSGDFFEFLTDVLDEWSGDDVDELFELLETQLGEIGIDLKYEPRDDEEEDEDAEDDDVDLDDDDEDDEEDEDFEEAEDEDD